MTTSSSELVKPVILIFPGQASQYVGMGHDLLRHSPAARAVMERACALDGLERLRNIILYGPDELLTRTDNVQPAMTIVSLMALAALREKATTAGKSVPIVACAGHSLGEYAAHVAAGNLSEAQAVRLTLWRGRWMNEASQPPNPPGAMVAVMGLALENLEAIADEVGREFLAVANLNSPGQVVLSGEATAVALASGLAEAAGAKRIVRLSVSGAWHSPLMKSAKKKMEALLAQEIQPHHVTINPDIAVVANASSEVVRSVDDMRDTLGRQITSPVIWTACVRRLLTAAGYPGLPAELTLEEAAAHAPWPLFVEVGPGKVLRGLLRGIDKGLDSAGVEDTASAEALVGWMVTR